MTNPPTSMTPAERAWNAYVAVLYEDHDLPKWDYAPEKLRTAWTSAITSATQAERDQLAGETQQLKAALYDQRAAVRMIMDGHQTTLDAIHSEYDARWGKLREQVASHAATDHSGYTMDVSAILTLIDSLTPAPKLCLYADGCTKEGGCEHGSPRMCVVKPEAVTEPAASGHDGHEWTGSRFCARCGLLDWEAFGTLCRGEKSEPEAVTEPEIVELPLEEKQRRAAVYADPVFQAEYKAGLAEDRKRYGLLEHTSGCRTGGECPACGKEKADA